jgi:hypothetical protein
MIVRPDHFAALFLKGLQLADHAGCEEPIAHNEWRRMWAFAVFQPQACFDPLEVIKTPTTAGTL